VRFELGTDAGTGHDDAGVAVAAGHDAEAAGFEVEDRCVAPSGEGVPGQNHLELAALEAVGGVDRDGIGLQASGVEDPGQCRGDVAALVAVGDRDGEVAGLEGVGATVLVGDGQSSAEAGVDEPGDDFDGFGVGPGQVCLGQFDVGPARRGGGGQCPGGGGAGRAGWHVQAPDAVGCPGGERGCVEGAGDGGRGGGR
jgi:hypothetical protein